MRKNVESLPFTIYDIIGYLAPGAVTTWLTVVFLKWIHVHCNVELLIHVKDIVIFDNNPFLSNAGIGIAFLALSYVVGHVISYLSAYFVEGLVTHHFGYPSFHLMASDETDRDTYIENRRKKHTFCKSPLIYIVLLPVVIFQRFFLQIIRAELKPLIEPIRDKIRTRFARSEIGGKELCVKKNEAWFRLIEATIKNNFPEADYRMYNYVVIYGFVRSFCLIFNIISWGLFIIFLICTGSHLLGWELKDNYHFFVPIFYCGVSICVSFILYLAFIKFFRRYSQETLEAFATLNLDAMNSE